MSKLITVNYNQKPCYNIVIENDFSKLAENVTKLEISGRKLAVITDSNVGPLYADKVAQCLKETGNNIFVYTFEAGEKNKNLNTVQDVYEFLIKNKFDRKDMAVLSAILQDLLLQHIFAALILYRFRHHFLHR